MFEKTECPGFSIDIFIAGPKARAGGICAAFCDRGLCVRLSKSDYIYTYGRERGVVVSLINYARFPVEPDELWRTAEQLAHELMDGLSQKSCSIVGLGRSVWLTREPRPC